MIEKNNAFFAAPIAFFIGFIRFISCFLERILSFIRKIPSHIRQIPSLFKKIPLLLRRCYIRFVFTNRLHPKLVYLWCFLTPAVIMIIIHAIIGVFPFGKMSVLTLDLNAQYVFFFEALRSWVYGEGSLLYSFSRSLGGEFLGIYAYYLASPLSYIVALFPKGNITEALYFIFVLKSGLCGLTFGILLCKKDRAKPLYTVLFSACYALIAYATVMQHNTMWIDNMILLPLIALGLRELIVNRRYLLFTLSLSLAILSNFYIGYMMCIFVFLFAFCVYFSMSPQARNPRGEKCHFLRAVMRVGLFTVIAVLISCLMILPAYYALSFGKTTFSNPNYSLKCRLDLLDLFKQLLPFSYDTVRPDDYQTVLRYEGWPCIYSGTLTLLLLPLYFVCRRIRIRERLSYTLMTLALAFSFSFDVIDKIWHGFQDPNWLNYRYSFMFSFLLVYMASRAMPHIKTVPKYFIILTCVTLLFLVGVVQYGKDETFRTFTFFGSLIFIVVYTVLLVLMIGVKAKNRRRILNSVLLCVVCVELLLNGVYDIAYLWEDVGMSSRASYTEYLKQWRPIIDEVKASDTDFYRMEKLSYRRMNDPSAFGFRGLTASTSTLNAKVIDFLSYMGISASSHWSEYNGSSPVTDSILGIRYIMDYTGQKRVSDSYSLYRTDGTHDIWKNKYALPIAFCVSSDINTISFAADDTENPDGRIHYDTMYSVFDRMNHLVAAMTGEDEAVPIYNEAIYSEKESNDESGRTVITYQVKATEGQELYAYFSTYMKENVTLSVGDNYTTPWFQNSFYGTIYIGKVASGDFAKVSLSAPKKSSLTFYGDDYFYSFDETLYQQVFSGLQKNGLVLSEYTEDHFIGTITATEEKTTVLTTIPYDDGWEITVDGKRIESYETLEALLAFDITEGTHDIDMRYMPEIYRTALKLSATGVCSLVLIIAADFLWHHFRKKPITKSSSIIIQES